ncbi:fluoride efflux transporter CrcB [Nocardia amikacinitolerans]|uniref:fluoride efflux transporter CrcB n=1 Tax=Nocardia amikacinitolerans TaxID=756689 RepID=UPI0020A60DB3|nr:fluoride efflux transporter CrcB [Nocardia amikacinitolerans]
MLAVISVGGGIGAVMRYLVGLRWPSQPYQVPWATFAVNVVGCFSIGILMVLITEVWVAHRLLRPFLGVGLLGGFTTFSTYSVEIRRLLESGAAIEAFGYLGGTVAASLGAVWLGMGVARLSAGTTRPRRRGGRQ